MKILKSFGISTLVNTLSLIIGLLLLTLLSYYDLISDKLLNIFEILLIIITMFSSGFMIGKKSTKKGWLEGFKNGFIFYVILFILNLLFIRNFNLKLLVYFILLILPSMLGSMIGILKK